MPTGTGSGTESFTWSTETAWNNGSFTDTTTDGSGNLVLGSPGTLSFPYELSGNHSTGSNSTDLSVSISDASTGTTLDSASLTLTNGNADTQTGTLDINATDHPDLDFSANVSSDSSGDQEAKIEDPYGNNTNIVRAFVSGSGSDGDSASETYNYVLSGGWTSDNYTFDTTTTATKLSWSGVTLPNSGDDITVTVENADATSTHAESLTGGSGSALFEIGPDDTYRLVVSVDTASDDTTPEIGSLTLEAHTPTDGLTVSDTRETEVDLSWNQLSVCDGYEVYQSESTPVSDSDTLAYSNTDATVTSTTISGLENGEQYYFNVRTIYSGE